MDDLVHSSRLSELVGLIYDCALDPARWPHALTAIRDEAAFATAVLSAHEFPGSRILLNASIGIDAAWAERLPDYEAGIIDLWGGPERAGSFGVGEPMVLSQVNPQAFEPPMHPYIREWGFPQGLIDTLALVVARDGIQHGVLGLGRHRDQGPIGARETGLLRLLAPHLQRAIAISGLLDVADSHTAAGIVVDQLTVPVFLLDYDRVVIQMNDAARGLLRRDSVVLLQGRRLTLTDRAGAQYLREAIDHCAHSLMGLKRRASGLPIICADGHVRVLHVLPLRQGDRMQRLRRSATAAVLIAQPAPSVEGVAEAVAALYDLTLTETRVFGLIASGLSSAEVTAALNIAPSTLKTHLLRIFDKLGMHRQVDLVRLAASMASPLI